MSEAYRTVWLGKPTSCPACGTAMYYSLSGDQFACADITCVNGHGLATENLTMPPAGSKVPPMTTTADLTANVGKYEADRIFEAASFLLSEEGENPEYDRGIVELVNDLLEVSTFHREAIAREIRARADFRNLDWGLGT